MFRERKRAKKKRNLKFENCLPQTIGFGNDKRNLYLLAVAFDVVSFKFQLIRTNSFYPDNCVFRLETQFTFLILKCYFASMNSIENGMKTFTAIECIHIDITTIVILIKKSNSFDE